MVLPDRVTSLCGFLREMINKKESAREVIVVTDRVGRTDFVLLLPGGIKKTALARNPAILFSETFNHAARCLCACLQMRSLIAHIVSAASSK